MTWNSFLEQCVEKYREIAGKNVAFKHVATPSLPEDTKQHPARASCAQGAPCAQGGRLLYVPGVRVTSRAEGSDSPRESAKGSTDSAGRSTEVRGELAQNCTKGSSWLQISLLLLIRTDTTHDYPTN